MYTSYLRVTRITEKVTTPRIVVHPPDIAESILLAAWGLATNDSALGNKYRS